MALFKCILIIFFCLGGMFSLSRVYDLSLRTWKRRADRSQIARLKTSNDLFMVATWMIAAVVCSFVFIVMALI